MKIGVVGAGFIGRVLTKLAVLNGHEVMISNSRGPQTLGSAAIALRCQKGTVAEAAAFGEVVILAIPFPAYQQLEPSAFAGKIVLDANNHYPHRDGVNAELASLQQTTSGLIARHLPGAKLVKFFNAILQEDIEKDGRPRGTPGRRALPIAGDDAQAKHVAAGLVDQFGYDPVDAGALAEGWRFERAMPAYCIPLDAVRLREALAAARRGVELPYGSWRRGDRPPATSSPAIATAAPAAPTAPAQPAATAAATATAAGKSHRGSFADRGDCDIVDAQFHLSPEQDASASLAAMNALGVRSALLDELWGFDAEGFPVPHARLAHGAFRALSPLAQAAALQHPQRFSFLQRLTRRDPLGPQLVAMAAAMPGCRSLRASLHSEDERRRFASGEWDELLHAAQQHQLPLSVLAEDSGQLLAGVAQRFDGLTFVVDHCGWGRTPAQWNEVLALARWPRVVLKWSHARKAFRRFAEPQAAMQREFLRALDAFGPERVLWAGDASYEESSATWSELLGFVRDNTALSQGDRAQVLGGTARRVFRWSA